eukprot:CAMPEP_0204906298 /NCGR_PEP_ID=MMETSP1397-20131031/5900_1 /ASSEMBLY_ACC=CAM_ASM_000891 /TAXON_ID=49980 /ORGANISM="Climacostomum Climacostomum virens, Strain Stock W-24" /LENGTH=408 /DNA_ID=CAMNT_0052075285 /DNA_START=783 /DNA_END=2006 /DNA_ORIENTATION=+
MDGQELEELSALACAQSKKGLHLAQIAQNLNLPEEDVVGLIARRTRLQSRVVSGVLTSIARGLTIDQMPKTIRLRALKKFVPEPFQTVPTSCNRAVIRERSMDLTESRTAACLGITQNEVEGVLASEDSESDAPTKAEEVQIGGPILRGEMKEFKAGLSSGKTPKTVTLSQAPTEAREVQIRKPIYGGKKSRTPSPHPLKAEERIEPPSLAIEQTPAYIYSYKRYSSSLFRTTLSTGETREETLINHTFRSGSVWCEVAGGDIYFTGGKYSDYKAVNEVVRVSGSSLEATKKAGMLSARGWHGSVYYKDYLYAIGGWNRGPMSECERLSVREDRWEALQPLPQACNYLSVVVVKETECLYALGGDKGYSYLDVIQRLRLGKLEWDVMPLRLPSCQSSIACFSKESKVW